MNVTEKARIYADYGTYGPTRRPSRHLPHMLDMTLNGVADCGLVSMIVDGDDHTFFGRHDRSHVLIDTATQQLSIKPDRT